MDLNYSQADKRLQSLVGKTIQSISCGDSHDGWVQVARVTFTDGTQASIRADAFGEDDASADGYLLVNVGDDA